MAALRRLPPLTTGENATLVATECEQHGDFTASKPCGEGRGRGVVCGESILMDRKWHIFTIVAIEGCSQEGRSRIKSALQPVSRIPFIIGITFSVTLCTSGFRVTVEGCSRIKSALQPVSRFPL